MNQLHVFIYTVEYYSVMKKEQIGSFVVMWMNLDSVIQSEVSQREKNRYRMLVHICGSSVFNIKTSLKSLLSSVIHTYGIGAFWMLHEMWSK